MLVKGHFAHAGRYADLFYRYPFHAVFPKKITGCPEYLLDLLVAGFHSKIY
jgi:hypothetical protein